MILKTLYKRSTTKKIVEWSIEVEDNKYRMTSGYTDGEKTTSAWTICNGKNIGKKNETTDSEQALIEAEAIIRKRIESGSFENINDIDNAVYYKPMLANKFEDYRDELKYPVYTQPKLDGVRCIVKEDGMWTRTGKPILSAPHIREDLDVFFKENPDLILDGELYCDKLANDFNKIISLVRKSKPTKNDLIESKEIIQYHIYDLPSSSKNFYERYSELKTKNLPNSCVLVSTFIAEDIVKINDHYEIFMSQGYEGQMIRLNTPYENKRSKSLLKNKEFKDAEYIILGMEEGKGNMSGKVARLYFETLEGKRFDASVNGDWEYLSKLLKSNDVIGKTATVKYFNITPDGIPRFPKVVAIRDYE